MDRMVSNLHVGTSYGYCHIGMLARRATTPSLPSGPAGHRFQEAELKVFYESQHLTRYLELLFIKYGDYPSLPQPGDVDEWEV